MDLQSKPTPTRPGILLGIISLILALSQPIFIIMSSSLFYTYPLIGFAVFLVPPILAILAGGRALTLQYGKVPIGLIPALISFLSVPVILYFEAWNNQLLWFVPFFLWILALQLLITRLPTPWKLETKLAFFGIILTPVVFSIIPLGIRILLGPNFLGL